MSTRLNTASENFSHQTLDTGFSNALHTTNTATESTITANQSARTVFREAQLAHGNFATALASSAAKMIEIADCLVAVDEQQSRMSGGGLGQSIPQSL